MFRTTGSWQSLSDYIRGCLAHVVAQPAGEGQEDAAAARIFTVIDGHLVRIVNSLADSGWKFRCPCSLRCCGGRCKRCAFRTKASRWRVQIMGILETRNLDFKNVLILSVNDDTFPATGPSRPPSFLTTCATLTACRRRSTTRGAYAYYFYRLIQRAERVHLVYCSRSDDKPPASPVATFTSSEYESPHKPVYRPIRLGVNLSARQPLSVDKTGQVADARAYLDGGQSVFRRRRSTITSNVR